MEDTASGAAASPESTHRVFMLATILQALDMTIANVALPHMQGNGCDPGPNFLGAHVRHCDRLTPV
jgi:hypothetical protein